MSIVHSVINRAQESWLRRRQHDSAALRERFAARYGIEVELYSYGCFDRWRMPGPMRIGRYCSIANTVRSARNNHPIDALTTHPMLYEARFGVVDTDRAWEGRLDIEDDVWIGHQAVLLPGCTFIGRGSVIGAGAIVTRPVERYSVVAGNPAKLLRQRFEPDLIAAIEASQWWLLDPPAIRAFLKERPELVMHPNVVNLGEWQAGR